MRSTPRFLAAVVLVSLPAFAQAETARPQIVLEVTAVKIEKITTGDNSHRITAIGRVAGQGWTNATLRMVRVKHPNNAVAGFEMVAVPPKKAQGKQPTEITATLETTIGVVQHTVTVRGRRKTVTCTMAGDAPRCE